MPLTKTDLAQIGQLLNIQRDQLNEDMEEIMKRHRSNFQEDIDPILKEVKASREDREAQSHQIASNSDRIEKLESTVFKN